MVDNAVNLAHLVKRRHPEYDELVAHWHFLDASYKGGRKWLQKNIFRYLKEGNKEFADRINRAYRFNHSREIVDLVDKYLFRADITRNEESAPDYLVSFWKDPTGTGKDMNAFARQMSRRTSVLGRNWVVIDNNAPAMEGGQPISIAEAKRRGVKVYAYIVSPIDMLDLSVDEYGNLNWVLIRERGRDDEDPFNTLSQFTKTDRYRLWTRNEWFLFEESLDDQKRTVVREVASGVHGLGMVPVTHIDHTETDTPYTSQALISDIAYLDRAVANYLSNLDAIIQDQTFSQLAMPAQGLVPGMGEHTKMVEAGTKRIFTFDGEDGAKPFFLSPDPKQAGVILEVIVRIVGEMYHSVGMAGERTKSDNAVGIDNSSGVAKAYDFERINAMLSAKAGALDNAEKRISRIVAAWHGQSLGDEDFIKYPSTFDVRGIRDELDLAAELALLNAPIEVRREQMKMLIDKLFPRISEQKRNALLKDVEGWPENAIEAISQAGLSEDPQDNSRPDFTQAVPGQKDNQQGQVTQDTGK